MNKQSLGDRMKRYEAASRTELPPRMPVIIRIDGKAFHTYTKGADRPFDVKLADVMVETTKKLCEEVQGTVLAYTQSDEISLLVHGYKKFDSQAWFDNQIQKMVSVAAGIASSHFTFNSWKIWNTWTDEKVTCQRAYEGIRPAIFDARAFVVPEADVCNYFLWRQQDAVRNSVQMLARSLFSHKKCDKKNTNELKQMCSEVGSAWERVPVRFQRGTCLRRWRTQGPMSGWQPGDAAASWRTYWEPDHDIPLFNDDREYVNAHLAIEQE